ncbi:MAG: hypothetical protein K2I63_03095 [Helicobacter sp.]|nr:hypothetical protein [Helicobacter sp.]
MGIVKDSTNTFVLLHNNLYPRSSAILLQNIKELLQRMQVNIANTDLIALDNKFLSLLKENHYSNLLKLLIKVKQDGNRLLIYDSQSLLEVIKFIKKLYEDTKFKDRLKDSLVEGEIDVLELERCIKFVSELALEGFVKSRECRSWQGFRCAFLMDRELEDFIKQTQFLEWMKNLLGLEIFPFYKESYDYLLKVDKHLAYNMAASDYYEMVDYGIDFIITLNIGNFELLDGHSKMIQKSSGRDDLEIPVLFLPQVLLATFRDVNSLKLCFNQHKITPKML